MRALPCVTFLMIAAAACTRGTHEGPLSDDVFIATVVELRRAATGPAQDPASFAAARTRILAANNVTEDQLRAYMQTHVRNPGHIAGVWERVNEQLTPEDIQ